MFEKWITNGTKTPFYTRKKIAIEKKIVSAVAKVCGLGQFNFYINGKKVEDHVLDPGWTNYHKLIQYVQFDVTGLLRIGENVIGAEVGNGWFIKNDDYYTFHFPPFMPPNPNPYKPFGKTLVFSMGLSITYEDGSKEEIVADNSFKTARHMVQRSNVFGSEYIDGREVKEGWADISYNDLHWEYAQLVEEKEKPKGRLTQQFQPPIKIIHTYEGQYVHDFIHERKENPRRIYDLGQNISGLLEAQVRGTVGEEVRFYPAEKLSPEGDADQMAKNWQMIDNCITYVIGKDHVWETCQSVFAYFSGRFIAVEGDCEIGNIKGHAITSAHEEAGSFYCDDERFHKIYDLVEKAVEANMMSVHTDCPTIERFAWQEPNHLMAPSIMYMKNGKRLWEKFFLDIRTEQHKADDFFFDMEGNPFYPGEGLVPGQAPCYIHNVLPVPGMGSFYDIIPWGSTSILGVYWHYQFYGDKKVIEDNYECGLGYLNYLKGKVNEEGFINHGLGDWGNPRNEYVRENIETAFLYADAKVLSIFAKILGREDEKKDLEEYAEMVRDHYNNKLLIQNDQGEWCYKAWDHPNELFLTQSSQALPLYWGMVPEDKKGDVVKTFRKTLEKEKAFIAGEIGLPYVIQVAREQGMDAMICDFILREEHPSYYAFVLDGETTLGEYWEKNPRSHCHDMMGHIVEWYYNGIAGIIPKEPGFGKVTIQPYLPESMKHFVCKYNSVKGLISVEVKEEDDCIMLTVDLPEEVQGEIDTSKLRRGEKEIVWKKR
ncbi:glycoside hydrolase family 78 protein [Lachnospiraceae bacterium OttesenSCG-928-D06]|nr:glycoside hydrolase family 78 protein [Lachnospiraceae bacterium OttesenSCG-928-D06]